MPLAISEDEPPLRMPLLAGPVVIEGKPCVTLSVQVGSKSQYGEDSEFLCRESYSGSSYCY